LQYGIGSVLLDPMDQDMEEILTNITQDFVCIFIIATYGEGEPTDNARDMMEMLEGLKEDHDEEKSEIFKNLNYAIFGLGNSTYEHYNAAGRNLDSYLQSFGGHKIFERGEGDDAFGTHEECFVEWKDDMWKEVCLKLGKDPRNINRAFVQSYSFDFIENRSVPFYKGEIGRLGCWKKPQSRLSYNQKNPFYARIKSWRELTSSSLDPLTNECGSCLHIELDIENSNIRYQTGDHVGVAPKNKEDDVMRLVEAMKIQSILHDPFDMKALDPSNNRKNPFPCPTTCFAAFSYYLDIKRLPKIHVIAALSQYASDSLEREHLERLANPSNKSEYHRYIVFEGRDLADVLIEHPSISFGTENGQMPISVLLELLPRLHVRFYSISSSPKFHPSEIHLTARVSRYKTGLGKIDTGVCTGYLESLCLDGISENVVPIFIRTSSFKLPKSVSKSVLMIGPVFHIFNV
jgi:NADPH-ferrihemoprotein reductase